MGRPDVTTRVGRAAAAIMVLALAAACGAPAPPPEGPSPRVSPSRATTATAGPQASPTPAPLPDPDEPVPTGPAALADALAATTRALRGAVGRWLDEGDPSRPGAPQEVVLLALYQQRMYRTLARNEGLWSETLARLPGWLKGEATAIVRASSELIALVVPISGDSEFETGPPPPAGELLGHFREGERRFGVDWEVLAAVCYVESKFARVHSASTAGAQGPMQFIPSTWEAYGMGGDVHDPHDAILGAANYLHASGAPENYQAALFAYNHSEAYVDAILRYARQMMGDARDYYVLYNWQVFVLTTEGDRRLTGPGL